MQVVIRWVTFPVPRDQGLALEPSKEARHEEDAEECISIAKSGHALYC
jgi:hypothetical protein